VPVVTCRHLSSPAYIVASNSPMTLPSVSAIRPHAPMPGIAVFSVTTLPPAACTFLIASSTDTTPTWTTGPGVLASVPVRENASSTLTLIFDWVGALEKK